MYIHSYTQLKSKIKKKIPQGAGVRDSTERSNTCISGVKDLILGRSVESHTLLEESFLFFFYFCFLSVYMHIFEMKL